MYCLLFITPPGAGCWSASGYFSDRWRVATTQALWRSDGLSAREIVRRDTLRGQRGLNFRPCFAVLEALLAVSRIRHRPYRSHQDRLLNAFSRFRWLSTSIQAHLAQEGVA